VETGLVFDYECFATGQSLVEVRLLVQGAGKPQEEICVNWIKQCSFSLPFVAIEDDYLNTIVSDSKPVAESTFLSQPVTDSYNMFYVRMTVDGLLRLRVPDIYVGNSGIGDVDIRLEDTENTFMEVSRTRTRVTVSYTCQKKGIVPVYMLLQRDWSAYTEILELHWEKVCEGKDDTSGKIASLAARIESETYGNQTQAVARGQTIWGFRRPCPRPGIARAQHEDENHTGIVYRDPPENCVDRVPKFLVPRGDSETVVHWRWESGDNAPEMLDTVVGYNARLMEAKMENNWEEFKSTVSYQCFADGIGNVTVTLYMRGMPPMDIAWRKKCTEPRAPRTGKAVTTKIAIGVILCLVLMFCCCGLVVCWIIRKTWDWRHATDTEKASIVGRQDDVTLDG